MPSRKRPQQLSLSARGKRGGYRAGAGRKPLEERGYVLHRSRPALNRRHPVHVTWKIRQDVPRLRRGDIYGALRAAFRRCCRRETFRMVHFTVQSNHVHLICEAEDARALSRGLQGLGVSVARRINHIAKRSGCLFSERYHARALKTPTEVRSCLRYVLQNSFKHTQSPRGAWVCCFSSALYFKGWCRPITLTIVDDGPPTVEPPQTWLLSRGFLRGGGPLDFDEAPA